MKYILTAIFRATLMNAYRQQSHIGNKPGTHPAPFATKSVSNFSNVIDLRNEAKSVAPPDWQGLIPGI
ncbi:MAG: hypothetical protein WC756_14680 [Taibaiella sp.]|jgi:hypothetical protein